LAERGPGISPSKSTWSRHAEPVSPPDLLPLSALTRASESQPRIPSASSVRRSRRELVLRQIERLPYAVFSIRGAPSQSCEDASSLALGPLVEFEPTPLDRSRASFLELRSPDHRSGVRSPKRSSTNPRLDVIRSRQPFRIETTIRCSEERLVVARLLQNPSRFRGFFVGVRKLRRTSARLRDHRDFPWVNRWLLMRLHWTRRTSSAPRSADSRPI